MEFFIKKIFDRIEDEYVHNQFQKLLRGEFKDRAMIRIKSSSGRFTIDTTSEYARELVEAMAEGLSSNKTQVTGALMSALELSGFKYESKSSALGVKKYMIDRELSGKEILELTKSSPKAFIALSFKIGDDELKIQTKSPKSAKGASGAKKEEDKPKIDFCKLKTKNLEIVNKLVFEKEAQSFKAIEIRHDFIITDIVIPAELKDEKDFAIIRERSKRKGKIIRHIDIDGKKITKESEFLA